VPLGAWGYSRGYTALASAQKIVVGVNKGGRGSPLNACRALSRAGRGRIRVTYDPQANTDTA
jgi:hypothetical protein